MDNLELRYRLLRAKFLRLKDSKSFNELWKLSKHLVNNPRRYSAYTEEDWYSIKMEALFHALEEYQPHYIVKTNQVLKLPNGTMKVVTIERKGEMSLISFIRSRYQLAIQGEIKKIVKRSQRMLLMDTTVDDDSDHNLTPFDTYCIHNTACKDLFFPTDAIDDEDRYQSLVDEVLNNLTNDIEATHYFELRLQYPTITNRKAAAIMKVPKTRVIACAKKVRVTVIDVIKYCGKETVSI